MYAELLAFAVTGRIALYLVQHFPPAEKLAQTLGQEEFYRCDLCLGVWVYVVLAWLFNFSVIETLYPLIDYLLTGGILSFLVHLLALGWKAKFETIVIES